jgi:hypothetical protein
MLYDTPDGGFRLGLAFPAPNSATLLSMDLPPVYLRVTFASDRRNTSIERPAVEGRRPQTLLLEVSFVSTNKDRLQDGPFRGHLG